MKNYLNKLIVLLLVACCLLPLSACGKKVCEHSYEGIVTTEATCQKSGVMTYTCSLCGDSYTENIGYGDHKVGSDNFCSVCNNLILCTTETEKSNSLKVHYIGDRQIWHQDDKKRFVLVFALKDEDYNYLSAPAVVEIKIVNENGTTVYADTKIVKSSDFMNWYYNNGTTKKYQGTIYINDDDIMHGNTAKGTIYFTVYNKGYFSFKESTLSISSLPNCNYSYNEEIIKEATCSTEGEIQYTCTVCGHTYTEKIDKNEHDYREETTKEATCASEGAVTYTCTVCGHTYTEKIDKNEHDYREETTKEATCASEGAVTYTCTVCGHTYTEKIDKNEHDYREETTKEATCTTKGEIKYTCTVCGDIYVEEQPTINHKANNKGFCIWCGEPCPIKIDMTESEKENASAVKRIVNASIQYDNNSDEYVMQFSLQGQYSDSPYYKAAAVVSMKIVNASGEVIYADTKTIRESDYLIKDGKTLANISIKYSDIPQDKGIAKQIYLTVYNEEYFNFSKTLNMPARIIIPTLPKTINYYSYSSTLYTSVKITNITYQINSSSVYLYFTGEKTYDYKGSNYSQSCKVGWKLYDSEGYLIESGTYYTDNLKVGEKFRDDKDSILKTLEAGETYTLELLSVK